MTTIAFVGSVLIAVGILLVFSGHPMLVLLGLLAIAFGLVFAVQTGSKKRGALDSIGARACDYLDEVQEAELTEIAEFLGAKPDVVDRALRRERRQRLRAGAEPYKQVPVNTFGQVWELKLAQDLEEED